MSRFTSPGMDADAALYSSSRRSQHEDAAEKEYQIHGSVTSFSCKPSELDEKAVDKLREINLKGRDAVDVHDDFLRRDPRDIPEGFFLSQFSGGLLLRDFVHTLNGQWKCQSWGYGISHTGGAYKGLKRTYAYYAGHQKTNWIMNVYISLEQDSFWFSDLRLCHVFQSNSYDPRPKRIPFWLDFDQVALNSRAVELEALIKEPKAFIDIDEYNEYYGMPWIAMVNGSNGKRSDVWKDFTPIKVLDPDGKVVLTLAICHHCSMVYQTGKDGRDNGTKTLKQHRSRCSGQHHTAENPQGAHHQMA